MTYVGWPLPEQLPTWSEIQAALLTPLSTPLLLDVLACLLWATWTMFVLDLARTVGDLLRTTPWPTARPAGPLRALTAALLGTIVLALLNSRPTPPGVPTYASASVDHSPTNTISPPPHQPFLTPDATARLEPSSERPARVPRPGSETAVVRPPEHGIHDSLWRIAARELGDGSRWPEIYALNRGRAQLNGETLTTPNLIRPGWVLRLPDEPRPEPPDREDRHPPDGPKPPSPGPDAEEPSTRPTPTPDSPPPTPGDRAHETRPSPGISLPTGAFVSVGLAALIAAAWLSRKRWHRVHYRPGSGQRDDLASAPVVRALRLAHDQTSPTTTSGSRIDDTSGEHKNGDIQAEGPSEAATPRRTHVLATKNGQDLALNLARTRGLGLVGPGALDATRALVTTLLAERHHPEGPHSALLMPAHDAELLLGDNIVSRPHLAKLRIVADLEAALDHLEAELLTRMRTAVDREADPAADAETTEELVLVATPDPGAEQRLQAILDNGSVLGLAGVIVGQWPPGATARVMSDGTVSAMSTILAHTLVGSRLFTLPRPDTEALLDLLRDADVTVEPPSPHTSGPLPATDSSPQQSDSDPRLETASRTHQSVTGTGRARETPPGPGEAATRSDPRATRTTTEPEQASNHASAGPPDELADDRAEPETPLTMALLGRFQMVLHHGDQQQDLTSALAPRQREVLIFLALHPDGARRGALATAIWPEAPTDRPYNALHATLSQLRRALRTVTDGAVSDLILHDGGRYVLDEAQVSVDAWRLQRVLTALRHSPGADEAAAVQQIDALYRGDLAEDVAAEWLEAPREALRRDVLDSITGLARSVGEARPECALLLLERARALDPYNEALYRDIARCQARLGHHDAIPRTLALLTTALAELDERPSQETESVCASLQRFGAGDPGILGDTAE
ncbi:hypothetical protein ACWGJ2_00945 [Streptomyces sp. NPDC054796]